MERRSYVLIGHPLRHSVSAAMLTSAFRAAGHPHTYAAVDVPNPKNLPRAVAFLKEGIYAGANVTLPYKRSVLPLVCHVADTAREIGAANVISRGDDGKLTAHNTDLAAVQAEIAAATDARGRAVVLGAGGAALAAIAACKRLGFAMVGVTTRSWADTEATYASDSATQVRALGGIAAVWPTADTAVQHTNLSVQMRLQWTELAKHADIVIQATSCGMLGGPPGEAITALVPFATMKKEAVALDLVYRPERTPFILAAEAAGLKAVGGLGMLVRQAQASYRIWMAEDAPPDVMREAALIMLARDVQDGQ